MHRKLYTNLRNLFAAIDLNMKIDWKIFFRKKWTDFFLQWFLLLFRFLFLFFLLVICIYLCVYISICNFFLLKSIRCSTKRDAFARKHFLRMCGCGCRIIRKCLSFHLAQAKWNTLVHTIHTHMHTVSGEANAYTQKPKTETKPNRIGSSGVCNVCIHVERKGNCTIARFWHNACVYSSGPKSNCTEMVWGKERKVASFDKLYARLSVSQSASQSLYSAWAMGQSEKEREKCMYGNSSSSSSMVLVDCV